MEQHTRRGRKIAKRMEKKQRRRGPQLPRQVISQTEGELIRIPKHVVKMIEPHQVCEGQRKMCLCFVSIFLLLCIQCEIFKCSKSALLIVLFTSPQYVGGYA